MYHPVIPRQTWGPKAYNLSIRCIFCRYRFHISSEREYAEIKIHKLLKTGNVLKIAQVDSREYLDLRVPKEKVSTGVTEFS